MDAYFSFVDLFCKPIQVAYGLDQVRGRGCAAARRLLIAMITDLTDSVCNTCEIVRNGICGNIVVRIGSVSTAIRAAVITVINPCAAINRSELYGLTVVDILSEFFAQNVCHCAACEFCFGYENNVNKGIVRLIFVAPLQAVSFLQAVGAGASFAKYAQASGISLDLATVNTVVYLTGVCCHTNDSAYRFITGNGSCVIAIFYDHFDGAGTSDDSARAFTLGGGGCNGSVICTVGHRSLIVAGDTANPFDCADRAIVNTVGNSTILQAAGRITDNTACVATASYYGCIVHAVGNMAH